MRWKLAVAGVAVAVAAGGWAVFEGGLLQEPAKADSLSQADLKLGGRLYQQNCATCHGMNRQGQPNWRERKPDGKMPAPPLDGSGHTWHHPDEQLLAIIDQGVEALAPDGYESDMKGFGDRLDNREMRVILGYIKSQWPEDIQERQATLDDRQG
ncbi:c-type cytochrome [Ferruginivarius sediminum]|uniref:Cytochrome c n=1 Tax=Ferruginivarius sediminum TaxID=2661937 RepID=A0A369TEF1_9PROT|nr:cytochrome c [Ferruginivarius sediminum]RDD63222.1 cytochrome c [Ferruginivarius sediminum]